MISPAASEILLPALMLLTAASMAKSATLAAYRMMSSSKGLLIYLTRFVIWEISTMLF